jgi:hypothetical protein
VEINMKNVWKITASGEHPIDVIADDFQVAVNCAILAYRRLGIHDADIISIVKVADAIVA